MSDKDNPYIQPFLTAQFEGIGGVLKMRHEDFLVEEVPLYQPSGTGTHIYALMEKKGLSTIEAVARVARALGMPRRNVGFAGLKDARAITRQWISVEHVDPERLSGLEIPGVKIIETARHGNKLKLGHLAGNRFAIRLREIDLPPEQAVQAVEAIMAVLIHRGVPNYFGVQRFGNSGNTHLLGETLARGHAEDFMDMFLGRPEGEREPRFSEARTFYEGGDYKNALESWPYNFADHRRALKMLIANKGDKAGACNAIDRHLKSLFISAYQSSIFNRVLALRMPDIDKLLAGDMACKHTNGACFRVEDAALEQPRCGAFEISPTGPLPGPRMTALAGPAGDIENQVLDRAGLKDENLRQMRRYGARGGRRPLRFQPRHAKVDGGRDEWGPYLELSFELDSGCYATSLVREIRKTDR